MNKKGSAFEQVSAAIIVLILLFGAAIAFSVFTGKGVRNFLGFGSEDKEELAGHPIEKASSAEMSMLALQCGLNSVPLNKPGYLSELGNTYCQEGFTRPTPPEPPASGTTGNVVGDQTGFTQMALDNDKAAATQQLVTAATDCWELFEVYDKKDVPCKQVVVPVEFSDTLSNNEFESALCAAGTTGKDLCGDGWNNVANYEWDIGTISKNSDAFYVCATSSGINKVVLTRDLSQCPATKLPASSNCNGALYGTTCVECYDKRAYGNNDEKVDITSVSGLVASCYDDSDDAKDVKFCSSIRNNRFANPSLKITQNDLMGRLKETRSDIADALDLEIKDRNGNEGVMTNDNNYYICSVGSHDIHIVEKINPYDACGKAYIKWKEEQSTGNVNTFECVVKNFNLPQNIPSSPLNWIAGYGDPYYLAYYEQFPAGEEKHWEITPWSTVMKGILVGGVTNALFSVIPFGKKASTAGKEVMQESAESGLKKETYDKLIAEGAAELTGKGASKAIRESLQYGTAQGVILSTKNKLIREVVSAGTTDAKIMEAIPGLTEEIGETHALWSSLFKEKDYLYLVGDEAGQFNHIGWGRLKETVVRPYLQRGGFSNSEINAFLTQLEASGLKELSLNQISREVADEALKRANIRNQIILEVVEASGRDISDAGFRNSLTQMKGILEGMDAVDSKRILELVSTRSGDALLTASGDIDFTKLFSELPSTPSQLATQLDAKLVQNAGELTEVQGLISRVGANLYAGSFEGSLTALGKAGGAVSDTGLALIHPVLAPYYAVRGVARAGSAVKWTLNHPYSFALGAGLIAYYFDSKMIKHTPAGVDNLVLLQPMGIAERNNYALQPETHNYYIETFKGSDKNSVRLYLGSPCVADLKLEEAQCVCGEPKSGQYDYYDFGGGYAPVERGKLVYNPTAAWGQGRTDSFLLKNKATTSSSQLTSLYNSAPELPIGSDGEVVLGDLSQFLSTDSYLRAMQAYSKVVGKYDGTEDSKLIVKDALLKVETIVNWKLESIGADCAGYAAPTPSISGELHPYASYVAGKCYQAQGKHDEAVQQFMAAYDLSNYIPEPSMPDDPSVTSAKQILSSGDYVSGWVVSFPTSTSYDDIGGIRVKPESIFGNGQKQKDINPASVRVGRASKQYIPGQTQTSFLNLPYQLVWYPDDKVSLYWDDFPESSYADYQYLVFFKKMEPTKDYPVMALFETGRSYLMKEDFVSAAKYFQFVIDANPAGYLVQDSVDIIDAIITNDISRAKLQYTSPSVQKGNPVYWGLKYDYLVARYNEEEHGKYSSGSIDVQSGDHIRDSSGTKNKMKQLLVWTDDDFLNFIHASNTEASYLLDRYHTIYYPYIGSPAPTITYQYMAEKYLDGNFACSVYGCQPGKIMMKHLIQVAEPYLGTQKHILSSIDTYKDIVTYHKILEHDANYGDDSFDQLIIKKNYYQTQLLSWTYEGAARQDVLFDSLLTINKELASIADASNAVKVCPQESSSKYKFSNADLTQSCIRVTAERDPSVSPNYCYSEHNAALTALRWGTTATTLFLDVVVGKLASKAAGFGAPLIEAPVSLVTGIIDSFVADCTYRSQQWPDIGESLKLKKCIGLS